MSTDPPPSATVTTPIERLTPPASSTRLPAAIDVVAGEGDASAAEPNNAHEVHEIRAGSELNEISDVDKPRASGLAADTTAVGAGSVVDCAKPQRISPYTIDRHEIQNLFLVGSLVLTVGLVARMSQHEPQTMRLHPTERSTGFRLDVNRASVEELSLLPQVGEVLAQRIVEERTKNGRFESLAELARTPGVGPSRISRLAELLVIKP